MSSTNHLQVDPDFSVYSTFMQSRPLNIFSERRAMLARWCASIEQMIIDESLAINVFTGFQHLEYFLPLVERYSQIAQVAKQIYVFGQARSDMPEIDKLQYVYLKPEDQLSKEWFLVINHPTYTRSLVALETSQAGTAHSQRTFQGVLTSDSDNITPSYQHLVKQIAKHRSSV